MRTEAQPLAFLDCTLRDGGYYNSWDFSPDLVQRYLNSMQSAGVDVVELGFRSLKNKGFKGSCAFTTDEFISSLTIPAGLVICVMVNGQELLGQIPREHVLECIFPNTATDSRVKLVRIACHYHEFENAIESVSWLKDRGYQVGINLMQVSDRSDEELQDIAQIAKNYPLDALYFADSMGSMQPKQVAKVVQSLRSGWQGAIGIHTHDNLGLALSNTLRALDEGATWVDSTITGIGRGPGNARTEELAIEMAERRDKQVNLMSLMSLSREYFKPMQNKCGWGTNAYYYLAGKYGIHPSYIQEMLNDSRYGEEHLLSVIEHLRIEGGKKFSLNNLDSARHFYLGEPKGTWNPKELFSGRDVLLIGAGPGAARHCEAIERYIQLKEPLVLALNTQTPIRSELISLRVACHPVRLLADCQAHTYLPQPLVTPYSMLPEDVQESLGNKKVLDFGISVQADTFLFDSTYCTLPSSLVVGYALAVSTCGEASSIKMAGFDGYDADDPRSVEMQQLLDNYQNTNGAVPIASITSTRFRLPCQSVYAI